MSEPARSLVSVNARVQHHNGETAFLLFRVAEQRLAFPLASVQEIRPWSGATRVPRAPASLRGVVAVRGAVVTVCDMRAALALPGTIGGKKSRLILTYAAQELMGFLVDEVLHVVRLGSDEIENDLGVELPIPILGMGRPGAGPVQVSEPQANTRAAQKKRDTTFALLDPTELIQAILKDSAS